MVHTRVLLHVACINISQCDRDATLTQHRQMLSAENKRLMDENVALTNKQTAQQDKVNGTPRRVILHDAFFVSLTLYHR